MIYIGIIDADMLTDGLDIRDRLPNEIVAHINKAKSVKERGLRAAAYLLLSRMYCEHIGEGAMPRILFSDDGKPCFDACGSQGAKASPSVSFNISHSEGLAAVCLSDDISELGIDIQAEPDADALARVARRFFAPLEGIRKSDTRGNCEFCEAEIAFYSSAEDGSIVRLYGEGYRLPNERLSYESHDGCGYVIEHQAVSHGGAEYQAVRVDTEHAFGDDLHRWTVLEAVLKADGGGFASYPDAARLIAVSMTNTYSLIYGGKHYSLTVAYK